MSNFKIKGLKWTEEEDEQLRQAVSIHGKQWAKISREYNIRDPKSCGNRWKKLEQKIDMDDLLNEDPLKEPLSQEYNDEFKNMDHIGKPKNIYNDPNIKILGARNLRWNKEDSEMLQSAFKIYEGDWKDIMQRFPDKSQQQCQDHLENLTTEPIQFEIKQQPDNELQNMLLQLYKDQQLQQQQQYQIQFQELQNSRKMTKLNIDETDESDQEEINLLDDMNEYGYELVSKNIQSLTENKPHFDAILDMKKQLLSYLLNQ